jgi:hypothetical protein
MSIAFRLLFLRKTAKTEKKIANEKSELEKKKCAYTNRDFCQGRKTKRLF